MVIQSEEKLKEIVKLAARFSDRGEEGLTAWAEAFVLAHDRVPGGLSIEIGTRIGGSAIMFIELLNQMYSVGRPSGCVPPFWTVDPYGSKPYDGGDVNGAPIYDDEMYSIMKHNLASIKFHTHWLMCAVDFFARLDGLPYWIAGSKMATGLIDSATRSPIVKPVGERHVAGADSATFILLDGEHTKEAILIELAHALRWVRAGGTVVIDNIDAEHGTANAVRTAVWDDDKFSCRLSTRSQWAIINRVA